MRGTGLMPLLFLTMPLWVPVLLFCGIADSYGWSKPWEWLDRQLTKLDPYY